MHSRDVVWATIGGIEEASQGGCVVHINHLHVRFDLLGQLPHTGAIFPLLIAFFIKLLISWGLNKQIVR